MEPVQLTGGVAVLATLLLGAVVGLLWRRANGRFRTVRGAPVGNGATYMSDDTAVLTAADLGAPLGERATLVQFSTAFCQPCRAARRILGEVAAMVDGVAHVEIDAESQLALVRRLDVLRTPTVLVLDAAGRVTTRAAGLPTKPDVLAALGRAVSP